MKSDRLRIEKRPEVIAPLVPQIIAIANGEKEALGFLAEGAYRDAVARNHIYLMVEGRASEVVVAGFILFGGVYPNASVQQIGVSPDFRRAKVGTRLMAFLVSELEKQSYLTLRANIASNLPSALNFYQKNQFEPTSRRKGGGSRNRDILVHVRHLNTPNLFSASGSGPNINIGIRGKVEAPLYAFDLNVLFDLVRSRARQDSAAKLFGAALDHRLRLAVAKEFIEELQRTSVDLRSDPILQMALRLPQLPKAPTDRLSELADEIHKAVFVEPQARGAGTAQARSDCRHLAHAAISRAAAFITSDGTILKAQNVLLNVFGIDVSSIDELLEIIPTDQLPANVGSTRIDRYEMPPIDAEFVKSRLLEEAAPDSIVRKYEANGGEIALVGCSIAYNGEVIAFGCLGMRARQDHYNMLVHVRPDHFEPEALADYLITGLVQAASQKDPATILLDLLPGQTAVHQIAQARGFQRRPGSHEMAKVAIGRPLTQSRWRKITEQLRRRTGVTLTRDDVSGSLHVADPNGAIFETSVIQLEDLLGPTVITCPGRSGVIVPIAKRYADELLGTDGQLKLGFIQNKEAAFLTRRGYVNSPRAAKAMVPGNPIFFYESGRTQGRAAIVAVARIIDTVIVDKQTVNDNDRRMLVVDELTGISASEHVLLTTFDNLLTFRDPVPLKVLRSIGAVGKANLISATPVSDENAAKILDAGWTDQ